MFSTCSSSQSALANLDHSLSSSMTLLHPLKGLRNLGKTERVLHHSPDLETSNMLSKHQNGLNYAQKRKERTKKSEA